MDVVRGDLIKLFEAGKFDAIAHGCNCFHTMGSGIAKTIRAKWPQAYEADLRYKSKGDITKLGEFSCVVVPQGIIYNIYSQYNYGYDGNLYLRYEALHKACIDIDNTSSVRTIGVPAIGCGLAGGALKLVKEIMEDSFRNIKATLVLF